MLKGSTIRAFNLGYFSFSLPVILFVVFSVYVSLGEELTPKRVFTTISLLSFARISSVHFIVQCALYISESLVAVKRIQVWRGWFQVVGGSE